MMRIGFHIGRRFGPRRYRQEEAIEGVRDREPSVESHPSTDLGTINQGIDTKQPPALALEYADKRSGMVRAFPPKHDESASGCARAGMFASTETHRRSHETSRL